MGGSNLHLWANMWSYIWTDVQSKLWYVARVIVLRFYFRLQACSIYPCPVQREPHGVASFRVFEPEHLSGKHLAFEWFRFPLCFSLLYSSQYTVPLIWIPQVIGDSDAARAHSANGPGQQRPQPGDNTDRSTLGS